MNSASPVWETQIKRRYSVRSFLEKMIDPENQAEISAFLDTLTQGFLGSRTRFQLVAATAENSKELKELGTYGTMKNPAGFIVGAVESGPCALMDYGYQLEKALLFAWSLGLGSCWLGGGFNKSSFRKKMDLQEGEMLPAVICLGFPKDLKAERDVPRKRSPFQNLFFPMILPVQLRIFRQNPGLLPFRRFMLPLLL